MQSGYHPLVSFLNAQEHGLALLELAQQQEAGVSKSAIGHI